MEDCQPQLEHGRRFFAQSSWRSAYQALSHADAISPLDPADLELLGRSAYMIGRDDDYVAAFERAHSAHLEADDRRAAIRCSFWIGHNLLFRGEPARAAGWFSHGERLLEREPEDCVERGYLLQVRVLEHEFGGDFEGARTTAAEIARIGETFHDPDLHALGLMMQGHALIRLGRRGEGVRLVDETMVPAMTGELSPFVAGIVFCYTIAFCRDVYELGRAREWTAALTRWCDAQPEMVAHKGLCQVHRAELLTLAGAWADATDEVARVRQLFTDGALNRLAQGGAAYCEGELARLRGEVDTAEAAYRRASALGREPQPGLALLRMAQGTSEAAVAAIRRAVAETVLPLPRASLLPAYVEIMLVAGDVEAAAVACAELEDIASAEQSDAIDATAAFARGSVALAESNPTAALIALRRASTAWQALDAPHEVSRARVLVGLACRLLGDEDTASLEFGAARDAFEQLGARPALDWLESIGDGPSTSPRHGLTERELEVLRLIATGNRNREIAQQLVVSEHTVARHVQNIFTKLGVSSRTAASAFAFEHHLVS